MFVIGDMASFPEFPAWHRARFKARSPPHAPSGRLKAATQGVGEPFHNSVREPFHYFGKGSMATVSRS